ncbi:adenylate/guanylate cyclase domain-containing protein [soil metagenome]
MTCARCGSRNPPGFRFCGQCGAPLPLDDPAPSFILDGPEAERRQLTVMFCDLVGSTPLAERVDPEDLRDILRQYRETVVEEIGRFGGHLAKYLGDGVVVYFGYPLAHEDDALRAVQAGMGVIEAMGRLNVRFARESRPGLRVRVGIHTGLVVAGEIGAGGDAESMGVVGRTPNVAARLEQMASPDTVVISEDTYRLVEGYFHVEDLGRPALKGVSEPVRAFRLVGSTGARNRMDLAQRAGATPLVGREREVAELRERWARARSGAGQVVLLEGEAGIGKSRLVLALKEALQEVPHYRLECHGSSHHPNTAFHPLVDLLHREIGLDRADPSEARLAKLERELTRQGRGDPETVALFASILGLTPPTPLPPDLLPERQRELTVEAVAGWLWSIAARTPILLVVEDLHWIDPSTLELLERIVDEAATRPVLVLLTARPPFRPTWGEGPHIAHFPVGRLSASQSEALAGQVAGKAVMSWSLVKAIAERADGIPLFVEELMRMVLESDPDAAPESMEIPRTLSDLLMARLDRVGTAKEVAQLAAMLGREFTYEMLQAIAPIGGEALQWELEVLVQAGLLFQYGEPPHGWYLFKHALVQESAYQSLLRTTRERYHRRIAEALATRFPEIAEDEPELLAHHHAAAGDMSKAVAVWLKAGQKSIEGSSYADAIGHLIRARDVNGRIPADSPGRTEQELTILSLLGPATMVIRGWAAPETEEIYRQALTISRESGTSTQLGQSLYGLCALHFVRGEHRRARELAGELIALGENRADDGLMVEGHVVAEATRFWSGDLTVALAHFAQVRALYDVDRHRGHLTLYGRDPLVSGLTHAGLATWTIGDPDEALDLMHEALGLAHRLSHPPSQAWALGLLALLHLQRREVEEARRRADEVVALASDRQRFAFWFAWGSFVRGWAQASGGDVTAGIEQMRRALDDYRAIGGRVGRPYFEALLAQQVGRARAEGEPITILDQAIADSEQMGELWYAAELHRIQGELAAARNDPETAERCYERALDLSRKQGARSLESRAVASLTKLKG